VCIFYKYILYVKDKKPEAGRQRHKIFHSHVHIFIPPIQIKMYHSLIMRNPNFTERKYGRPLKFFMLMSYAHSFDGKTLIINLFLFLFEIYRLTLCHSMTRINLILIKCLKYLITEK
jgi:hypothetical protein